MVQVQFTIFLVGMLNSTKCMKVALLSNMQEVSTRRKLNFDYHHPYYIGRMDTTHVAIWFSRYHFFYLGSPHILPYCQDNRSRNRTKSINWKSVVRAWNYIINIYPLRICRFIGFFLEIKAPTGQMTSWWYL